MITLHHLNNSRSQRILWLLEELGLEYDVKRYERDPETLLAPESLRKVHPLGKSPIITDGALTLAESGAIIEYLVDRYGDGKLAPAIGEPDRLRYIYWLHYAEGSAMPPLVLRLIFEQIDKRPKPFFVRPISNLITSQVMSTFIQPQIDLHLNYLESELQNSPWFVSETFTAADIQMSFPVEAAAAQPGLKNRPNLKAFLDRAHSRPAYQQALERGGEYDYA